MSNKKFDPDYHKYRPEQVKVIQKRWGTTIIEREEPYKGVLYPRAGELFVYNEEDEGALKLGAVETVKILYVDRDASLSLHFHCEKDEIFCCAYGRFELQFVDPKTTKKHTRLLYQGTRVLVPHGTPHRITGLDDLNILIEVSTQDRPEDSYRIEF